MIRASQPHFTVDPGWPPHGEDPPNPGRPKRMARFPDDLRQQIVPHKKAKRSEPIPGWFKTLAAFKKQRKRKKITDLRVKRKVRVAGKRDIAQTRMNTG